ncbi:MAG: DUF1211 domain-containing protein [Flavobacteriales bacterium]|nr:DUF1211 domain-containing protein [Flavobacteriales bacterium]MCB9168447.1 DUF1211 domain-containing protein [Flavobacteriales bacterium]
MTKGRLEAFSDGVLAIIITIMVLEMKVPHGDDLAALLPLWPTFLSYVLSFVYLAIYWNNHHHLMHTVTHISSGVMWGNMLLLFNLSLIPFVTGWMGENHFAQVPTAIYGVVLLGCALSWVVLQNAIIRVEGKDSALAKAVGRDRKGRISQVCYISAIPLAFVHPGIAGALFALVALIWIIPDTRIAKQLQKDA